MVAGLGTRAAPLRKADTANLEDRVLSAVVRPHPGTLLDDCPGFRYFMTEKTHHLKAKLRIEAQTVGQRLLRYASQFSLLHDFGGQAVGRTADR